MLSHWIRAYVLPLRKTGGPAPSLPKRAPSRSGKATGRSLALKRLARPRCIFQEGKENPLGKDKVSFPSVQVSRFSAKYARTAPSITKVIMIRGLEEKRIVVVRRVATRLQPVWIAWTAPPDCPRSLLLKPRRFDEEVIAFVAFAFQSLYWLWLKRRWIDR